MRWSAVLERWTGLSLAPLEAWPCWSPSLTDDCVSLPLTGTIPTVTPSAISPHGSTPVSLLFFMLFMQCYKWGSNNIVVLTKYIVTHCPAGLEKHESERLIFDLYFTPSTVLSYRCSLEVIIVGVFLLKVSCLLSVS